MSNKRGGRNDRGSGTRTQGRNKPGSGSTTVPKDPPRTEKALPGSKAIYMSQVYALKNPPRTENMLPGLEAMQNPLSNDWILESILKNLRTKDLIGGRTRLVSSQWNRVVNQILKNRTDAYIRFDDNTDFEALESCIKKSTDFPFHDILLVCTERDFGCSPEKWLKVGLFRQYSTTFTRLRLSCFDAPSSIINALLSGPFNHIDSLTLNRVTFTSRRGRVVASPDSGHLSNLRNLKTITFWTRAGCQGVDLTFLRALLQSCPSLERIENITNAHLSTVAKAGKLEAVKSLRVCCCINDQEDFPMPSEVETLTVDFSDHVARSEDHVGLSKNQYEVNFFCLEPLLVSNQETLQRIGIYTPVVGGKESSEDWPILSKLKSLKLMKPCEFPASVVEIFPALETLQICAFQNEYFDVRNCMWTEPLSSVTKLEVLRSLNSEEWKCLSEAVPNVRRILMNHEGCKVNVPGQEIAVMDAWSGVSHFKQLETLCVSPIQLTTVHLDELLTGIPESWLRNFRGNPKLPVPSTDFVDVSVRDGPNVACLAGLKELILCFTTPERVSQEDLKPEFRVTPHLVAPYGFKSLKPYKIKERSGETRKVYFPVGLSIRIMYDHWDDTAHWALSALEAYVMKGALPLVSKRVTFGHWNANLQDAMKAEEWRESAWVHFETPRRSVVILPPPSAGRGGGRRMNSLTPAPPVNFDPRFQPCTCHQMSRGSRCNACRFR